MVDCLIVVGGRLIYVNSVVYYVIMVVWNVVVFTCLMCYDSLGGFALGLR